MGLDLATQITMYIWPVNSNKEYVLYILSGMWGMADAIWKTQINGIRLAIYCVLKYLACTMYAIAT